MKTQQRTPILIPLALIVVGGVILLNNFLIIDADILGLWPILLILLGVQVLVRGDLAPSWQAQTFGITRGSVETASLEINSAEIDVRLSALDRAGRLIAGQYTARSRPRLTVRNNHAHLIMRRGSTWLFSLADWEITVAQDLPWSLLMSSHLGEIQADLRGITIKQAHIASGIGNIAVFCPDVESGEIYVRSTFGDIQIWVPRDVPALITIKASPLCKVITPKRDFRIDSSGKRYATASYQPDSAVLKLTVAGTFGNITLSTR